MTPLPRAMTTWVYPSPIEGLSYAAGKPREESSRVQFRSDARVAEGAPLLREYRVKSLIEGSNPSHSARTGKVYKGRAAEELLRKH